MKLNQNPYSDPESLQAWDLGYAQTNFSTSNKELMAAWKEGYKAKEEDLNKIPLGPYCYHGSAAPGDPNYSRCPFWEKKIIIGGEFCGETYGYCSLIKMGDFSYNPEEETTLLLHDQCKECGINTNEEEDLLE